MSAPTPPFIQFLRRGCDAGGFGTDDVIGAFLPLLKQVGDAHQNGLVAPLDGPDHLVVDDIRLRVPEERLTSPRKNPSRISELQKPAGGAIEVVGESRQTSDLDAGRLSHTDLLIGTPGEELKHPVYLPNYVCWEHPCGHHDQLTDIFSLGLVLASLACSLDLSDPEDLELFVRNRNNLFNLNERLHPVIAGLVVQMTELNRHRRVQTVETVVLRLANYRDQSTDFTVDFHQLRGFRESAPRERGQIILAHLRNRLFEISRRNRLIHFRPTLQTLNLTLASVPLLLDHRNIKPEQLFLWHSKIAAAIAGGESITLGSYVRFEDAPYASSVLDQIIATERRDRQEFGFAQLRLVLCFLRWHNLKETPEERIHSPLLLLPVELIRKKGVRDSYVLKPLTTEAEVNPALRHHLRQLYGLNLPEFVDLSETTMDAFHGLLAEQIRASEPGVTLRKHDRPQIELIHERAKQRLDQFRRRQRLAGRGPARFESFDYSYEKDRFRPLGLQLFLKRVKPSPLPFAQVAGKAPAPRMPHIVDPLDATVAPGSEGTEREKQFYAVKEPQGSGNPYEWDFDLCSLTLGNFNYRKMSLVRDYAALLEQTGTGKAFEAIFSLQPRTQESAPIVAKSMAEQFPIVDCDPTQTQAVTRARTGASYIIQGPPGTGKSQTITNLIADYVARGQRVLFVCEKRAAIDVVFHRLGRQGLDQLCCLIHDSQTDKRDFIRNLKQTYETFLSQPLDETIEARRTELIRLMDIELAALRRWSDTLASRIDGCSLSVRALLARLVELRDASVELDPLAREWVPSYAKWPPHAELLHSLAAALARLNGSPAFAQHSFRHLTERVLNCPQPLALITSTAEEAGKLLAKLGSALDALGETVQAGNLGDAGATVDYAVQIADLAAADALDLLNPRSTRSKKTGKAIRDWRSSQVALEKARADTAHWRKKLTPTDTAAAFAQAQSFDKSFLRWLQPAFWRLRRLLNESYDFSQHAVLPTWSQILTLLTAEHTAAEAEAEARLAVQASLGEVAADTGVDWLENSSARIDVLSPAARALHHYLLENPEATYVVENLAATRVDLARLQECLSLIMVDYATYDRKILAEELRKLRADLVWLPDVLPLLAEVLRLPAELQQALRRLPLSDRQMEAAMARQSYDAVARQDRAFEATGAAVLSRRISRLRAYHREWLGVNARWIHQKVRREFLRKVQISSTPAAQLAAPDKELKRLYATGRRELEHEFSKTMRHRSIRDLADDETGIVLRDLKPVWLMSPLSVSDTLPLAQDVFDVVIFDEASQILMEEAVPAVSRATQIIVVGDEMQLPPTNFFSATRSSEESLGDDEETSVIVEDLDAESFLTQAARNLPATMLGWHYRSRSEALISYSNHAFYEGRLLTVPDQRVSGRKRPEIVVYQADDARTTITELLARSISFHFLPSAVYESRRNTAEADYIARLLRELFGREDRPSIGIVAFSEAQQGEIESAINRLGDDDTVFRNRLETEYEREDEGQFNGLFVKNLENVQGDERDIIILSICYGYDRNRRMLMNFGPINQRGGEKRLNVIFSRARKHMAVVSSIKHFDITNDFNDGANCLRNFLEYSAAASTGDGTTAHRVLQAANPLGPSRTETVASDVVATQIAKALAAQGWTVESEVGHSTFRLPLAVRRADDERHTLGILIDDDRHYAQQDLLERYLQRPGILEAFGWRLITVYTKDWLQDSESVMRQLERALAGEKEPEPDTPDETPVAAIEEPAATYGKPAPTEELPPVIAPIPTAKPLAAPGASHLRRFVCTEEGSSKFWEVSVSDKELTVRFGRIGTKGQSQTRAFTTAEAAQQEQAKLIRSKVAKGYTEEPLQTTGTPDT